MIENFRRRKSKSGWSSDWNVKKRWSDGNGRRENERSESVPSATRSASGRRSSGPGNVGSEKTGSDGK